MIAYAAETSPETGLDVYVRSPAGRRKRLTSGPLDEFSPAWSPDGRTIAYRINPVRGDEGEIWTMSASGKRERNLTRSPGVADWSPAYSPDAAEIAYMSDAGGTNELWIMGADGSGKRQLTGAGELSEYPSWYRTAATWPSAPCGEGTLRSLASGATGRGPSI